MEQQQQATTPSQQRSISRRMPGLEGVTAKVLVEVGGQPARMFAINDGLVETIEPKGPADGTITVDDPAAAEGLLNGKLNPMVLVLQGRLRTSGDRWLVASVLLELQGQAKGFGSRIAGEG
jgi:hypothetical protein